MALRRNKTVDPPTPPAPGQHEVWSWHVMFGSGGEIRPCVELDTPEGRGRTYSIDVAGPHNSVLEVDYLLWLGEHYTMELRGVTASYVAGEWERQARVQAIADAHAQAERRGVPIVEE